MFEWDRQGALTLLEEYKAFWGPSKNSQFGITGKPDANTGKANAKSVYLSVENHGRVGMSRKNIDFSGGGAILEKLKSFASSQFDGAPVKSITCVKTPFGINNV